jgi:hypothetical protein
MAIEGILITQQDIEARNERMARLIAAGRESAAKYSYVFPDNPCNNRGFSYIYTVIDDTAPEGHKASLNVEVLRHTHTGEKTSGLYVINWATYRQDEVVDSKNFMMPDNKDDIKAVLALLIDGAKAEFGPEWHYHIVPTAKRLGGYLAAVA